MLLLLVACREPADRPAPTPESAATVRYAPGPDLAWGDVPWPSDLHRDDAGHLRVGDLPGDPGVGDAVRELLATRDGFCTTCAAVFTIDGELDPDSVPAEVDALDDPIVLVDVALGEAVPLHVQWADGRLTVRPRRPLRARAEHALLVTDAIRGADGLPLGASPAFDPPAPHVVGGSTFTTGDPARAVRAVRDRIVARTPGPPGIDRTWTGAALDELLGTPSEDRPGVDVPPAAGTGGSRSVRHETTAIVVSGTFRAARFVTGTGTDLGTPTLDDDGLPVALGDDDVPYVLIVPAGADTAHLPVVVSHHGFNASRTTGFVLADTAGHAGYAVLAIDAYQHGARAPSANDARHAVRGDLDGPDGFAETSELDVSGRVFGLVGPPADDVLSPAYPLAAFTQFGADALSAVALVRDGDWSAVAAADPALEGLAFDPDRVVYVGNSMGAVVGTAVLTAEPELPAVLDVLPGGIVDTLCESGEFRALVDGVLLPNLGIAGPFDDARALALDPVIDLYRAVLEPVDPLALGPSWGAADVLVQLAGHDEVAAPGPSEAAVAAAGIAPERFAGAMHGMLEERFQVSVWAELSLPLVRRAAPETVENPIEAVHAQIEAFLP